MNRQIAIFVVASSPTSKRREISVGLGRGKWQPYDRMSPILRQDWDALEHLILYMAQGRRLWVRKPPPVPRLFAPLWSMLRGHARPPKLKDVFVEAKSAAELHEITVSLDVVDGLHCVVSANCVEHAEIELLYEKANRDPSVLDAALATCIFCDISEAIDRDYCVMTCHENVVEKVLSEIEVCVKEMRP